MDGSSVTAAGCPLQVISMRLAREPSRNPAVLEFDTTISIAPVARQRVLGPLSDARFYEYPVDEQKATQATGVSNDALTHRQGRRRGQERLGCRCIDVPLTCLVDPQHCRGRGVNFEHSPWIDLPLRTPAVRCDTPTAAGRDAGRSMNCDRSRLQQRTKQRARFCLVRKQVSFAEQCAGEIRHAVASFVATALVEPDSRQLRLSC